MNHYLTTRRALPLLFLLCTALMAGMAHAEGPRITWDLKDALKQVDRQADDFQTLLARVEVVRKKLNGEEASREQGTILINRDGRIRMDMDAPNQRSYLLLKKDLYIHYPQRKQVEHYSLSRHKDRLEPFIRLGFTTTGKDLKDDYLLTSLGEQDIADSRTLGLDLTPERDSTREIVSGVELWIDQASWMPTRQLISSTAAGETVEITYRLTARNLNLNPDLFKSKWPRGTDKVKM